MQHVLFLALIGKLEPDGGEDGGEQDDEDDEGEDFGRDEPARDAPLRADEDDFRPHHHAEPHAQGIAEGEAAEFCAQPAADELAEERRRHIHEPEREEGGRDTAEIFDVRNADVGKEDGGEEEVSHRVHLGFDIGRLRKGAAQQDARDVRTRDVGNAEELSAV